MCIWNTVIANLITYNKNGAGIYTTQKKLRVKNMCAYKYKLTTRKNGARTNDKSNSLMAHEQKTTFSASIAIADLRLSRIKNTLMKISTK